METVVNDLIHAQSLLRKGMKTFNYAPHSLLFYHTQEPMDALHEIHDFTGKRVCSVAGSGDQCLDFFYHGAKEVTLFDINRLSLYFVYLKLAAAKVLDFSDFLLFLNPFMKEMENPYFLSFSTFEDLKHVLPPNVRYFWEQLFKFQKTYHLPWSRLFRDYLDFNVSPLAYLSSSQEYNHLQESMKDKPFPTFFMTDFRNLEPTKTYDIIYLSNILNVIGTFRPLPKLSFVFQEGEEYWDCFHNKMAQCLSDDGEIINFFECYPLNRDYIKNPHPYMEYELISRCGSYDDISLYYRKK